MIVLHNLTTKKRAQTTHSKRAVTHYAPGCLRRLIRRLINCHLRALALFYKKRPVPLSYWLSFHSAVAALSHSSDPLLPSQNCLQSSGASLPIRELKEVLRHDLLGMWALDADTIAFLWKRIQQDRPKVIIECGAGVSTLALAKSIADYESGSETFASLLSFEQDLWVKKGVEKRLEICGLKSVTILHAPISKEGEYQFDENQLREHLGSEKVDWVIVDGPAGPEGCRVSTLPFLARFCRPGARWFLDDSFRDGELRVLNQWNGMHGIVVEGIYPIGKGLGVGIVADPQKVARSSKTSSKGLTSAGLDKSSSTFLSSLSDSYNDRSMKPSPKLIC